MKWVDTNDEMPAVGRRVLCAMYAETEHPYWAGGFFDGEYWIIDDVQQLVDKKKIQFWAPVAQIPRRER